MLILVGMMSFVSCSSDDDDGGSKTKVSQQALVGKWKLKSYVISTNVYYYNDEIPVNGDLYLNLNKDGSCSITGHATYDLMTDDGIKVNTGDILLSDYDVTTWTFGDEYNYDAFIALHYYNNYQKMQDYIGFGVRLRSSNQIELHQSSSERDYYIFQKVG